MRVVSQGNRVLNRGVFAFLIVMWPDAAWTQNPPNENRSATSDTDGVPASDVQHAATADDGIKALVTLLGQIDDIAFQADLLQGIEEGLKGRRQVPMPEGWQNLYHDKLCHCPNVDVRQRARRLALVFGDEVAANELRTLLRDITAPVDDRRSALQALHDARVPQLLDTILGLIDQSEMRADLLRALSAYDDRRVPQILLHNYPHLSADERRLALDTLTARAASAHDLLIAVADRKIPPGDLSAETIRKLRLLKDDQLNELIDQHWGKTRSTPAEVAQQIAVLKSELEQADRSKANVYHGRAIFARTCQQCHQLFGTGGKVGPDITGSHRANLDYVLTNVVDPNAMIGKDYQAWNVFTTDGQIFVGLLAAENETALTLRTATEMLTIPKDEIEERELSEVSMMPVGLLDRMTPADRANLVAYLATTKQAPIFASAENASELLKELGASRCTTVGAGWSIDGGTNSIRGDFEAEDSDRTITTDIFLFEGELQFELQSDLHQGELRITLGQPGDEHDDETPSVVFGCRADGEISFDLSSRIEHDSDRPRLRLGPAGEKSVVKLVVTAREIQLYLDDHEAARLARPANFGGGVLGLQASAAATGKVTFQLRGLSAPNESLLMESWEQLRQADGSQ